jgi:uncharacterized protein (TIGR00369 family)
VNQGGMEDGIPLHKMLQLKYDAPLSDSNQAEVRMEVHADALGFTGNLHGGAIATMVDLACALAAAQASGFDHLTQSLVTADMHVRYLGRPRTDEVIAKAEVVRVGRQLIVIGCRVVDTEDNLVAHADFSMMIVTLREPLLTDAESAPGAPEL